MLLINKNDVFKFDNLNSDHLILDFEFGWEINRATNEDNYDIEVSAFLLNDAGKVPAESYVVFYGSETVFNSAEGERPYSGDGSVIGSLLDDPNYSLSGPNNRAMRVYLDKVWDGIHQIRFTMTITKYPNDVDKDMSTLLHKFGNVKHIYLMISDSSGNNLMKYTFTENVDLEDAIELGRLVRAGSSWQFVALGKSYLGSLPGFIQLYT